MAEKIMTPDEVVKVLEEIFRQKREIEKYDTGIFVNKTKQEVEALSFAISFLQDYQKLKEEIDRLRVQLAGCGAAALGYATGKNAIKKGSYGWSASFQDVVDLWDKHQKLRERVSVEKIDSLIRNYAFRHECNLGNEGIILEKSICEIDQAIVTYLQQPTEQEEK